ncbi:hypothetical protein [Streptomyces sp. NBC_01207]|uniref:hypothetical protein n=1 Tax=Streptomyces sp. NBC_01207 TaxID=2903772 RepID=UPI002E1010B9|nr:hypothetical protein OG457_06050 [Streptomyces sp. NBC_01207]
MLRLAGIPARVEDTWSAAGALVGHGVMAFGDADQVACQLARYHAAGTGEIVRGSGDVLLAESPAAALEDVREIATTMRNSCNDEAVVESERETEHWS